MSARWTALSHLSPLSQRFITGLNNPFVERAAMDSLERLTAYNIKRGHPDPERAGLKVLETIHSFPMSSYQPNAVFNSGGDDNLKNRRSFLDSHKTSAYGDWHLQSTAWISDKIPDDPTGIRLSLFNFNSARMAQQAALDGKNIIPFTEGLSVVKSPHSIWAKSECTSILYESLNNPKASGAKILGKDASLITQHFNNQHLDNPGVIYPFSDYVGRFVGDGKHFDLRVLDGKEMSITVPGGNQSQRWDALLSKDPSASVIFSFNIPKERVLDASSVQLVPPSSSVAPTGSAGQAQPASLPDPRAIVVGPLQTPTAGVAPVIVTSPLINDRTHPDNKLFQQALAGVNQLDRQQHRASDVHSEQLAAAVATAASRNDLKQIDRVELSKDGTHVFAIQGDPKAIDHRQISVNTLDGLNTPIEKSTQVLEAHKAHAAPKQDDPRHADHPAHAEFQGVRQLVSDLHARHGVPLSEEQRDRLAAAVIHDAHNNQLGPVKELRFSEDKGGKIQPDGNIIAFNGDPHKETTLRSATNVPVAQETPVVQSFKQMANVAQQQQQQQQPTQAPGQVTGGGHPGGR
jgi:hypothetical protein